MGTSVLAAGSTTRNVAPCTGHGVDLRTSPMRFGDGGNDRQPEAGSARRTRPRRIGTNEALEHVMCQLRIETRTVIQRPRGWRPGRRCARGLRRRCPGDVCVSAFARRLAATWRSRSASPSTTTLSSTESDTGRSGSTARASRTASSAMCPRSTASQIERTPLVEASEQQHVVDEPAHPCRFVLDATHRVGLLALGRDRSARATARRIPRIEVSGVRSSCDASATNRRRRSSDSCLSSNAPSIWPSIVFRAMPSLPTSVFVSAGATRRDRSPSAMAFAVIAIFSIGRTPWRSNHHAIMHKRQQDRHGREDLDGHDLVVGVVRRTQRLGDGDRTVAHTLDQHAIARPSPDGTDCREAGSRIVEHAVRREHGTEIGRRFRSHGRTERRGTPSLEATAT